ncbi:MAG: recombination protein RecR [Sedimentisphaerales bacterium]|nr:recombination protein RecR [Sedimentisphaerales bacterium]
MSNVHTDSINQLMEQFRKLPGIGPRNAERLAYHILKQPTDKALALADAIRAVKEKIRHCARCFNLCEAELCEICQDPRRDHSIICVVEQPKDLICLEETGLCNFVYHVLLGRIAPLDGITPDDLTIDQLLQRIQAGNISEVILATNPNMDGDGTALYLNSLLDDTGVKVTRLARGLPSGGTIEYANKSILTDAITGRKPI